MGCGNSDNLKNPEQKSKENGELTDKGKGNTKIVKME